MPDILAIPFVAVGARVGGMTVEVAVTVAIAVGTGVFVGIGLQLTIKVPNKRKTGNATRCSLSENSRI
jgi:hypothetical protein